VPRIGVLLPGTAVSFALRAKAFVEGLRDLGYVDGQTVAIEWKWGQDKVERLPELAADLVGHNVDVIVTGGTPAAKALRRATDTIPIVMAIIGDPIAAGLVANLSRPGGNATGFSIVAPELSGKRLELLKEIVPEPSPVAVMMNTKNPQSQFELKEMEAAATAMGPNHARHAGAGRALICDQPILLPEGRDPGHLPQCVLPLRARKATLSSWSVRHYQTLMLSQRQRATDRIEFTPRRFVSWASRSRWPL
jgi:hypothetical protein